MVRLITSQNLGARYYDLATGPYEMASDRVIPYPYPKTSIVCFASDVIEVGALEFLLTDRDDVLRPLRSYIHYKNLSYTFCRFLPKMIDMHGFGV